MHFHEKNDAQIKMDIYPSIIFNGNPRGIPNSALYSMQSAVPFTYYKEERKILQAHVKS